jgi:hypothetical protein
MSKIQKPQKPAVHGNKTLTLRRKIEEREYRLYDDYEDEIPMIEFLRQLAVDIDNIENYSIVISSPKWDNTAGENVMIACYQYDKESSEQKSNRLDVEQVQLDNYKEALSLYKEERDTARPTLDEEYCLAD